MSLRRVKRDLCKFYNLPTKETETITGKKGKVLGTRTFSILKNLKLRTLWRE